MKDKKITIKEIAREAGVSISTVSRVINSTTPVSESLKSRVIKAIEKLGYTPDHIARGLRKGQTGVVGFVLPDISNPFFATTARGAEDFLRCKGYVLMFCDSDQNELQETEALKMLLSRRVDGLLFTGTGQYNKLIDQYRERQIPVVFLDRIYNSSQNISYVVADNIGGMRKLVDYLVETGHKSFALLNGNKQVHTAQDRYVGFTESLENHGLKNYTVVFGEFTYESGKSMVRSLTSIPDAIVCGNDLIAYGAIEELELMGYRVPEDVSVTGFDDIPFSKHYKPPLTTVKQPAYEMGKKAAEMLLKMMKTRKNKRGIVLETQLVVRSSTNVRRDDGE